MAKKKIIGQRRDCTPIWLIIIVVRSEVSYAFMPLNGGSKRKNGLNIQKCLCVIITTH